MSRGIRPRLSVDDADEIKAALKLRAALHRSTGEEAKAIMVDKLIVRFEQRKPGRPKY